jgi:2-polyprenyl-6-methoxyphenol hydroxylase-like FAD-dependent oxidoreductase
MTTQTLGKQAVVIGGSVAGLLTAGVLANHFEVVTVIERDDYPDTPDFRKGVPQGRHAHGLSTRGFQAMKAILPGLHQRLLAHGALLDRDAGQTMRAFQYGAFSPTCDSGVMVGMASRALLDWAIRQELAAFSNIGFLTNHIALGLEMDTAKAKVVGIRVQPKRDDTDVHTVPANLVVDTSGRGSQLPKWLESHGYPRPDESDVRVNVGYATRIFQRSIPDDKNPPIYFINSTPPQGKRLAAIFPMEGQKWMVTLAGSCGDYPPTDEAGYRAFARTLPVPNASEIIENETPEGEIVQYRFPSNYRRHYEKLPRFPQGLMVLGDTISSFNPIYGQGMTISAIEAESLKTLLSQPGTTIETLFPTFMKRILPLINDAWGLATGEDFRHPEVEGKRPPGTKVMHRFLEAVARTGHKDTVVYTTFLKIVNMQEPPSVLFSPSILWRVAKHTLMGRT